MSDSINNEWDSNYVPKCLALVSNRYWAFLYLTFYGAHDFWLIIKVDEISGW